jgi:hypothetical protein
MTFPCASLIVMIVLLNVEWMCTTPSATIRLTFFRRRRGRFGRRSFRARPSAATK